MKRIFALMLAFCMLMSVGVFANIELPLSVYVDGSKVDFPDAEPFVDSNSRTLVPVRFVSEALKATVAWDGNLRQVTITKGEKVVTLVIDKKEITVNGETKILDSAPIISESRTFVPIRFVSEALDATVSWDGAVRTVYISTKKVGEAEVSQNNVNINGFEVSLKPTDRVVDMGDYTNVIKESGLGIQNYSDGITDISFDYSKKSKNNPDAAKKEILDVVSQKVSSNTTSLIEAYLNENMTNKTYVDALFVEDNGRSIMVSSSSSGIRVIVYNQVIRYDE